MRVISLSFTLLICLLLPHTLVPACEAQAGGDYVIVYPASLQTEIDRLVLHRQGQGLRVVSKTTAEIATTYGGGSLTDLAVRGLVTDMVTNWSTVPTYLVLIGDIDSDPPLVVETIPTHVDPPSTTPLDFWFVTPILSGHTKPLVHIGRIPVVGTVFGEAFLANFLDKLFDYETMASATWMHSVHQAVGDTATSGGHYEPLIASSADAIWQGYLSSFASASRDHRSNYASLSLATEALKTSWNSGIGVLAAYGQTFISGALVSFVDFRSTNFVSTLNSGSGTPIVLGGTCEIASFHDDEGTTLVDNLLFSSSDKGATAILAACGVVTNQESEILNAAMYDGMVNGASTLGQLLSIGRVSFLDSPFPLDPSVHEKYVLLGDPAQQVRAGFARTVPWKNGFEIEDDFVLQNTVVSESGGTANNLTKLLSSTAAVEGERVFKVALDDLTPSTADFVEWKICELDLPISKNTILSTNILVNAAPSGAGRVAINAETQQGSTLRLHPALQFQDGSSTNAIDQALPVSSDWIVKYVDLTPLAGEDLSSLSVRYEAAEESEQGALDVCFDYLRVFQTDMANTDEELLNRSFEEATFSTVNYWEPTSPVGLVVLQTDERQTDGMNSLLVLDQSCSTQGIQQVFHSSIDSPRYLLSVDAYSASDNALVIRCENAETNTLVMEHELAMSPGWGTFSLNFPNPDYAGAPGRILVKLLPIDCSGPVYFDNASVVPTLETGIEDDRQVWSKTQLENVSPNPVRRSSSALSIDYSTTSETTASLQLYDLNGRLVSTPWRGLLSSGSGTLRLSIAQERLSGGMFFLRLKISDQVASSMKIVVLN